MASNDAIYMDVPEVKKMAGQFDKMGQDLNQFSKTLEATINMLKATAFISAGSTAAYAQYLEWLKPQIDKYAGKAVTMADDLKKSAEAYERGDAQGAARFH